MYKGNVIAAIWLIGLGILFLFDIFWPGILILVGISMIARAMLPAKIEKEEVHDKPEKPDSKPPSHWVEEQDYELPESLKIKTTRDARFVDRNNVPENCLQCGGPIKANQEKVEWLDENRLVCPFCGIMTNLSKDQESSSLS